MSHNVPEDKIIARKEGHINGRKVEHLIVDVPGLSFKSLVCIEQDDGTMGAPVSADNGAIALLKPSMLMGEYRLGRNL
ncbi:hypothetical protein M199_gp118 [Halogranum tailed virus 1]|uniref:Uncharacterized protein n=1 Tax=Halogranum tailed virus 1 TaxID=1273749 RepID=R4TMX6_9CAUD|nr:hypothetical protein M199_gp118 [Halogranum tailed virus 1]AGM11548.1 hypothetical protein HGTV1_251 [Halogranum tailed virus 1]